MVLLDLTKTEAEILEAIEQIGFGELFNIQLPQEEEKNRRRELHEATSHFFAVLRRVRNFDTVKIHGGLPAFAEKEVLINGIKGTEKFKFT